jgi:hypothetical protein
VTVVVKEAVNQATGKGDTSEVLPLFRADGEVEMDAVILLYRKGEIFWKVSMCRVFNNATLLLDWQMLATTSVQVNINGMLVFFSRQQLTKTLHTSLCT